MKKIILTLLACIAGAGFLCYTNTETVQDKRCTKENVYQALKREGVQFVDIAFAQIMLESGELKSRITRTNNNFLGMKMPAKRETTAIAEINGYAFYPGWEACIKDYVLFQRYVIKGKHMTRGQYLAFIGKRYSECSTYKKRVLRVIKENREFMRTQDSVYYCSTL